MRRPRSPRVHPHRAALLHSARPVPSERREHDPQRRPRPVHLLHRDASTLSRDRLPARAQPDPDLPLLSSRMRRDADLASPPSREAGNRTLARVAVDHPPPERVRVPIERALWTAGGLALPAHVEWRAVRLLSRHGAVGPLPLHSWAVPRFDLGATDLRDEEHLGAADSGIGNRNSGRCAQDERRARQISGEKQREKRAHRNSLHVRHAT